MDLDDFSLGDICFEKEHPLEDQCVIAIGKKGEKEASCRICINVSKLND